jgi:hypothetical protein
MQQRMVEIYGFVGKGIRKFIFRKNCIYTYGGG